jgi:tRNA-2-methylthio-N6-dimethylallyladenosine synthase
MKRGYTALEYKEKIRRLRAARPDVTVTSDFIIGFPGETERDFQATFDLVRDVGFDQSFSFLYSRRPGTPAASLPDEVPEEVKLERLARLQAQLDLQESAISEAMVGSVQRVLIDAPAKRNRAELAGRTANNRRVNFAGPASLLHRFSDVMITDALRHTLRGRLLAAADAA